LHRAFQGIALSSIFCIKIIDCLIIGQLAKVDLAINTYVLNAMIRLNVVNLVGRVGMEPDVRYFESGTVKCRLTLAVDRRSRNSDQPDWFNLGATR